MPTSACCSARTSGVAIRSLDFHSNHAVLDDHREGVDGHVRRQVQGLSGTQVEPRPVPGAFDRTLVFVQLALDQFPVVVRAAVLDGEDLATAVDHADLEVLPLDEALLARWELFNGADVDQRAQIKFRFRRYGFYRGTFRRMDSRPLVGVTTSEVRRAERTRPLPEGEP